MENLEEKLERISKFGMREVEVLDENERVKILMAQNNFLQRQILEVKEILEMIVSAPQFGEGLSDCVEMAQEGLEKLSVREWKKS